MENKIHKIRDRAAVEGRDEGNASVGLTGELSRKADSAPEG